MVQEATTITPKSKQEVSHTTKKSAHVEALLKR